jgi:histidyl-tRNA synthetase
LLPLDQIAFQGMLDTIRRNFERFGFLPVETPVMELSEVLLTKSGGETERQVYFVQSTGALEQGGEGPELALRFDLTVPLARYVAEHEHDLAIFRSVATRCSACIAASARSAAASASSTSATST